MLAEAFVERECLVPKTWRRLIGFVIDTLLPDRFWPRGNFLLIVSSKSRMASLKRLNTTNAHR